MTSRSPRDRFLTVYGRMPVLEALRDDNVPIAKVFVAHNAHGESLSEILVEARRRSVDLERVKEEMITALARSSRHHQGVAADVAAPAMSSLEDFLQRRRGRLHRTSVLLADSIHNPSNLGMIIRSATAAGLDAIIVPSKGTAELGPLVIKASAGVAFRAPIVRCDDPTEAAVALTEARFQLVGLDATMADSEDLFTAPLAERAAYVLGNETTGLCEGVASLVTRWLRIPVGGGVESLNVACAATLLAYEVHRRVSDDGKR